jgi:type III secretion protein R
MGDGTLYSVIAFAVLAAIPFVLITATSFVKISVVFSILRNALGTGEVPSGAVITALALILSAYVMTPVGEDAVARATPAAEAVDLDAPLTGANFEALLGVVDSGKAPLIEFLVRNSGERERELFFGLAVDARRDREAVERDDFFVVLPAFLISELGEAFLIGFLVFVPFLVVDLVISNVLLGLGMHMLSPTQISLPFKLLLFVLVDGWYVLAQALVSGYS